MLGTTYTYMYTLASIVRSRDPESLAALGLRAALRPWCSPGALLSTAAAAATAVAAG